MNKNQPRVTFLDGEKLFKVYFEEMGTARSTVKLAKWCVTNKWLNPETHRKPTRMALWFSMWKWALRNPDAAYPIYNKALKEKGEFFTPEQWKELLLKKATTNLTPRQFERYVADPTTLSIG